MKKFSGLLFSIWALALLTGCIEEKFEQTTPQQQLAIDQRIITDYLDEQEIEAQEDSIYGLRFVIHEPGTGVHPELTDTVNVSYVGRYLKREDIFDSNDSIEFRLNQLIPAWQIAIPYLKVGGSMTMYVPSGYAYGNRQVGDIPPNSNLEFDVTLNEVRD